MPDSPAYEDPGPPPSTGIVVRPQGEGFYARISPRPWPRLHLWLPATLGFLILGVLVGWAAAMDPWLHIEITVLIWLFGLLLLGLTHGAQLFPVEIVVDDTTINWGGERIPIEAVADCRMIGRTLELVSKEGTILGLIEGVNPNAGRWVSLAIRASLPHTGGPSS